MQDRVQHASVANLPNLRWPEGLRLPRERFTAAFMASDIHKQVEDISALLTKKLGLRARTFQAQVHKARRLLPRALRRDLIYLAQAESLADNPKLHRMIDMPRLDAAHRNALAYLDRIDIKQRRWSAALGVAASIAFGLLITAVLVIVMLVQRGLV
jgi:hypothetical protein